MIDVTSQVANIEAIMKLMEKYEIDEVSIDFINIKKSRFKAKEPTEKEVMDQHTKTPTLADAQAEALNRIQAVEEFMNGTDK